ncbi:MAG: class I SAM-dependent methyltransferase [Aristaeellaceae bacterium]
MDYQQINADTIDRWCQGGWEWGIPISHEAYQRALQGDWQMFLTPTKPVPRTWLGDVQGCRVLGLASGGGQQMPIFAALGAQCTLLDYSPRQCESDRMVAAREGYDIRILQADMTKPLPFPDETFDLIFHPVSNCYVEQVKPIFRECFRILRRGGVLLCGLDNGISYAFDETETTLCHTLPYNPLRNPALMEEALRTHSGVQFSHTLEEQLGGQLEAGFRLTDVYEDYNTSGPLADHGIPTFWATRAVKA